MALRRIVSPYLPSLLAPITYDVTGALCLTCGRPVDKEEIVEGYPGRHPYSKVLVTHHGAEELRTFEFDSVEWDERDLRRALQGARFFDPLKAGEGGFGAVPANDNGSKK